MMQISGEIISGVKAFLESGNRAFLETLGTLDRNDIQGQAVIRYLMQIKHWPFTPDSEFANLLTHFFAAYPERKVLNPGEYQASTAKLIQDAFDYECIVVVPEPKEVKEKTNPGKRTRKPKMVKEDEVFEEGESGSRTFKSLDTTGASDRLKKVIDIQRGVS